MRLVRDVRQQWLRDTNAEERRQRLLCGWYMVFHPWQGSMCPVPKRGKYHPARDQGNQSSIGKRDADDASGFLARVGLSDSKYYYSSTVSPRQTLSDAKCRLEDEKKVPSSMHVRIYCGMNKDYSID